ncbi:MAG: DUF547 domain-containing protein [Bacteroidota bacterium]
MKNIWILCALALVGVSCGTSKKVVKNPSEKTSETATTTPAPAMDTVTTKPVETVKEITQPTKTKQEMEEVIEPKEGDIIEDMVIGVETTPEVFNHSVWNELLKEHVSQDGRVNYEGFRQNKGILRDYIASLGAHMPQESWTQEDRLAYWMNAYNAMTIDLILRNLPLQSIKDIDKPWNQRLWKLGSKWYNLDEIEHQILRKMDEPRIHFGINCASFSCPPLLNEAFTSVEVDSQLDALARAFVNDTQRNTLSENSIQISKLFSWFAKDFKTDGSLIDFLNKYSNTPISSKAKKSYKTYDWSLNN